MRQWVTKITVLALTTSILIWGTASRSEDRRAIAESEINASLKAMGGKDALIAVQQIEIDAVGHRNMLEQSLRPEGPWWEDYFQRTELQDFASDSERTSDQHRGYSSKWWLQRTDWISEPDYPTVVVSDGVAVRVQDGKFSRASGSNIQNAEEELALGPTRVLLTALAAPDLRTLPDITENGYRNSVIAFTWHGYPVRLVLNGFTKLPDAVEWTGPRPYDVFWNVWGDVTTRVSYGGWSLEAGGARYPRQWTIERNGLPEADVTITSLKINPKFDARLLMIPGDVKQEINAKLRTIDDLPLGSVAYPATEIEPGLIHIPGAWNVNLVRQDDGIVVIEGPISSAYTVQVLNEARRRYPDLPVKAVVTTSDSWPHLGGMREFVARGVPIYALDLNKPILERLFAAPHAYRPDNLQKLKREPTWHLVSGRTTLGSGSNRLEIIPYRTETGERQMMVFFPEYRLLYTSDLFAPDEGAEWFTPEYLLELKEAVDRERLSVDKVFGMHYDVTSYKTLMDALDSVRESQSEHQAYP